MQNKKYKSIKSLVFELIHQANGCIDYKIITEKVKKYFPKSKWKKTHWAWYRSQIIRGRYKDLFSSKERLSLKSNKKEPNQETAPKGLVAERMVRNLLEEKFQKKFYTRRKDRTLIVGYRSNGEEIKHEFDLVSEDKNIIGEVKSAKYTKKHHSNTRLFRILGACKYLELVKAKKKLLVLTNKKMHEIIKHDLDGLITPNIEVSYMDIQSDNIE